MFGGSFLGGVPIRGMGQAQIRTGSGFVDVRAHRPSLGVPARTPAPPPPPRAGRQGGFMGQVNLVTGPSATPFYASPTYGYFANPSGNPLMTPEITSPQEEHIAREYHCYTKDGQYRSAPFASRDMMKAEGWEETDYRFCSSPPLHAQPVGTPTPILMGQNGGPSGGQGQGGGGTPSGQPSGPSFARQFGPTDGFGFPTFAFPTYPLYPPPVATSGKMTCKRIVNEDTGEERFECVPKEQPAVADYRYPTYFVNPFFF